MYCSACGNQIETNANFCPACGAAAQGYPPLARRLYRSRYHRMIGGVCAGIALYNGWDISVVRIIAIVLMMSGVFPLAYIIAWIVIPQEPILIPVAVPMTEPRTP